MINTINVCHTHSNVAIVVTDKLTTIYNINYLRNIASFFQQNVIRFRFDGNGIFFATKKEMPSVTNDTKATEMNCVQQTKIKAKFDLKIQINLNRYKMESNETVKIKERIAKIQWLRIKVFVCMYQSWQKKDKDNSVCPFLHSPFHRIWNG